jgi:hypothetical protein
MNSGDAPHDNDTLRSSIINRRLASASVLRRLRGGADVGYEPARPPQNKFEKQNK